MGRKRIVGVGIIAGLLLFGGLALDWPILATIGLVGALVAIGMLAAAMRGSTYSPSSEETVTWYGGGDTSDSSSDGGDSGGSND